MHINIWRALYIIENKRLESDLQLHVHYNIQVLMSLPWQVHYFLQTAHFRRHGEFSDRKEIKE